MLRVLALQDGPNAGVIVYCIEGWGLSGFQIAHSTPLSPPSASDMGKRCQSDHSLHRPAQPQCRTCVVEEAGHACAGRAKRKREDAPPSPHKRPAGVPRFTLML